MRRCIFCWLLLSSMGCKMCQNPYDYAGPTIGPNGQPVGTFTQRSGSAFNGTSPPLAGPQSPTPAAPTPTQRPPFNGNPSQPGTVTASPVSNRSSGGGSSDASTTGNSSGYSPGNSSGN